MAWPRTGAGTIAGGTVATGDASYMRWGTKDALPGYTYLVITRIRQARKKEDLQFDNGDGVQSGRMQVFHGVVWEITVRDHTNLLRQLVEGSTVTIVDMVGHGGNPGLTYNAYVLTCDYDAAPKQPGERTLSVERIALIEGAIG